MSLQAWPWSIGENALPQMWFNLCHVQTLLSPWASRKMIAHFYATEDWTVLRMLFLATPVLWRALHWVLPPWHLCNTDISWGCNLLQPTLFTAKRCGDWKVDIMHLIDTGGRLASTTTHVSDDAYADLIKREHRGHHLSLNLPGGMMGELAELCNHALQLFSCMILLASKRINPKP